MAQTAKAQLPKLLRVLVADDLGFMRIAMRKIIETDGDMQVVGEARNGAEAVALARELQPDVVTMDIEMPVIDGIEATRRIVEEVSPRPIIIMVSSHTQAGAAATMKALRCGAADFVSKQSEFSPTDLGHIDSQLRGKIRSLAQGRDKPQAARAGRAGLRPASESHRPGLARPACEPPGPLDLVVVAASTGGPATLGTLLRALGPIPAPIAIAQHMPQFFTACLADSLGQDTGLTVREGGARMPLLPGEATILPGGRDAVVAMREGGGFELRITQGDGAIHPSADLLLQSAAMVARRPVAVILTGMGDDGTRGAARFVQRRLPVLVQRPETCVVGGMPGAAIEAGVASEALPIEEIARRLRRWAAPDFSPLKAEMADR